MLKVYHYLANKFEEMMRSVYMNASQSRVNRIINRLPSGSVLAALLPSQLSSIENFLRDGGNDRLFGKLEITPSDLTVVLGGYLGDSAHEYRSRFDCSVLVVEPVPEYLNSLTKRFSNNPKVKILDAAVGENDGFLSLTLKCDGTSAFLDGPRINVRQIDIAKVIAECSRDQKIAVLELNIEGSEYGVLRRLLKTEYISRCTTVLIQFHEINFESEIGRAEIRSALNRTHNEVFNYPWVWERWDLIKRN